MLTNRTKWKIEPDYADSFDNWQQSARTPADNAAFLNEVNPMINKQLLRFEKADQAALRPKAKLLALNSMSKYDPTKSNLNTYYNQQLQKLNREYNKTQQIIHVPENKLYDRTRIVTESANLESELGRAPTTYELSDRLHMSPAKIGKIMSQGNAISHGAFDVDTDEGENSILPAVVSPVKFETMVDLVYPDLNPIDQLIFEHSFGLYGKRKLTPALLAKKLKVSQGTISLRKKFIQQQLDKAQGILR